MNTSTFLTAFLFEIVSTLPYRVFAYYPFRRQLRFRRWITVLMVGITELFQCSIYALLVCQSAAEAARRTEFFFAIICFLVFCSTIRADKWKILFLYIFTADYTILVRGIAVYLESHLFYSPALTFTTMRSILLHTLILALTSPFWLLFLKRTKDRVFQTEAPALWHVVWILPLFTTALVMMYTADLSPESVQRFRFFFSRVLLIIGMFGNYYVLLHSLDVIRQEAALAEKTRQQEYLLALQRTQYSQISRHMEETRRARHDLSHHLRAINGLLAANDLDGLRKYIAGYEQELPPKTSYSFCQNYAVNTIISYYAAEAEKADIDFTAGINLPPSLPVNETDLCSILGNLLENALTACLNMKEEKAAFIHVLARADGANIDLAVDNSSLKEPIIKNGQFVSTHHEGYGIGTASVRAVAEKYQGIVQFRYKSCVFYASVNLFGKETPASHESTAVL